MWREMIIFADRHTIKQTHTNSKTEAHSYPLWIVGERANMMHGDIIERMIHSDAEV